MVSDKNAIEEHEKWRMERLKELQTPLGWPSVVGLYYLSEDRMTVGSDEAMDILFPTYAAPFIGEVVKEDDSINFYVNDNVSVTVNEGAVDVISLFDQENNAVELNHGSLYWYIIERGGQPYLRLKDTLSKRRQELVSIPHFPYNENMVFDAQFTSAIQDQFIPVTNMLGQTSQSQVLGQIQFKYQNADYTLQAFDGGEDILFVIFADDTTGDMTYGGGRFMYLEKPRLGTDVRLDFNRAINPPCVFTDYATCPLPPKENRLPILVNAGEKYESSSY